jgi:hypothetical protein
MAFPLATALQVGAVGAGMLSTSNLAYNEEVIKRSTLEGDSYYQGYIEGMPGAHREVDIVGMQRELNTFGKTMRGLSVGMGLGSMIAPDSIGRKERSRVSDVGDVDISIDESSPDFELLTTGFEKEVRSVLGSEGGGGLMGVANPYNLRTWENMKMQPKESGIVSGFNQRDALLNKPVYTPPIVDYSKSFGDFTNQLKRLETNEFVEKTY